MASARASRVSPGLDTISGQFAAFAAGLRFEDLPAQITAKAGEVLLDTLGCALAGSGTDEVARVRAAVVATSEGGSALIWGTDTFVPAPFAALANGTAVHAREMDDFEGCLHSGAVIVPAALSVALQSGASGRELLSAITLGYDIARRVLEGAGGNLPLKRRGWHSTSVCGGFGAAAAAGYLLKLDVVQLQSAMALAGSTSGGTWAFVADGPMSKRLHPGFAAQNGVMAAYLARSGVTGPVDIFEAEWGGFFSIYAGDDATPERAVEALGSDYKIAIVGVKPYAACRGNHSSIDAILALRAERDLQPQDVSHIRIGGNELHVRQLGRQHVATPMEAQFSLPYSVATALVNGSATLEHYSDAALQRPDVQDLAGRIEVVIDGRVGEGEQPFVEVHLNDGRVYSSRVTIARGDRRNPLSTADLRQKYRANAAEVFEPAQIADLETVIDRLADLDNLDALARLLQPSGSRSA